MGDARFNGIWDKWIGKLHDGRVPASELPFADLVQMLASDAGVKDPYVRNVLASEALNRIMHDDRETRPSLVEWARELAVLQSRHVLETGRAVARSGRTITSGRHRVEESRRLVEERRHQAQKAHSAPEAPGDAGSGDLPT